MKKEEEDARLLDEQEEQLSSPVPPKQTHRPADVQSSHSPRDQRGCLDSCSGAPRGHTPGNNHRRKVGSCRECGRRSRVDGGCSLVRRVSLRSPAWQAALAHAVTIHHHWTSQGHADPLSALRRNSASVGGRPRTTCPRRFGGSRTPATCRSPTSCRRPEHTGSCEAQRKGLAKHWQCHECVQKVEDKPRENEDLKKVGGGFAKAERVLTGDSVEIAQGENSSWMRWLPPQESPWT